MNRFCVTVYQGDSQPMTFQVNNHDLQSQLATAVKTDPEVTRVEIITIWEREDYDVREEGIIGEIDDTEYNVKTGFFKVED